MVSYAELAAATNFSFLHGASHPSDMVGTALALGQSGIGIADRNSVAGVVRAWVALRDATSAARDAGHAVPRFKLVTGARLVFADGTPDIIAYPVNRSGWGHLCRLLTTGNLRAKKGECHLFFEDLLEWMGDLILIVIAPPHHDQDVMTALHRLHVSAPGRIWIGVSMLYSGAGKRRLAILKALSRDTQIPLVAINDALYATPDDRPLHDIMTCIRHGMTIHNAGKRLEVNAERHLKSPAEMARLFADAPEAIAATQAIVERIHFTLDDLRYHYPDEPIPDGWTPMGWLIRLTMRAARKRFRGTRLTPQWRALLVEELTLIRAQNYAHYFLTVHDIVAFARDQGILCQGRGSAANSVVCFLLGITSVDPVQHNLLFSRFISDERRSRPISTSISSMNGARKSCNISIAVTGATARASSRRSSISARVVRCVKSAKRWG